MPVATAKTRTQRKAEKKEARKAAKKAKRAKKAKKKQAPKQTAAEKKAIELAKSKAALKRGPEEGAELNQRPMPTTKKRVKNQYTVKHEIVEDKMIPFSFDFAVWYHELPKIKGERSINDDRVANMVKVMADGEWSEGHGEISLAKFPDGIIYRLNGQHRCWARFEFGDNDFQPLIRVVTYAVNDMDEYRELYIRFDNPNTDGNRTTAHLIKIALYGTEEFDGVSSSGCTKLAQGYRGWMYGFSSTVSRKVTIAQLCKELRGDYNKRARAAASLITQIAASNLLKHLNRKPVFAAIFETLKYPTHASEFWQSVIDGLFTRKTDATKILSDYLHRTGIGNRKRSKDASSIVTSEEMYNVCVKCFNAGATGKALTKTPPGPGQKAVARI